DVDHYAERSGEFGAHQAIVPGAWDGWMLWLREYGRLDLGDVLAPAIRYAEDGFPVTPSIESRLRSRSENIETWPDTGAVYLREDGSLMEEGDTIRIPDMAETFRELVAVYDEGLSGGRVAAIQAARDHFYRGPFAQAIVEFTEELDGYLTIEDFHGYEAEIVEPISIDYNGIEVFQNPPSSQGITQLLALNILRDYDLSQYEMDSADAVHLQVEAIKLAFADRYHHVGDPDFVEVPVAELLSDDYAASQRQRIRMDSVLEWPLENQLAADRLSAVVDMHPEDGNTTTYHILDAEGNAAAVTTSLGYQLMVVGDTGIHLNNRMRMFSIDPSEPNYMEPGKKVRHTSNPYMALRDGRPYILGGNTGNDMQPQGQVQQFVSVVDFGATAQEAVDRPRFESRTFPQGIPPYTVHNDLRFEDGFDEAVIRELESRGHTIGEGILAGAAAMIVIDHETKTVEAAAETRGDGSGVVR
ncbi:MAG: gamma-glutamyltransferase family protein, partial [bacterium]